MPFTPADGENYDEANAYCDVAFADDYHLTRGNTAWAAAGTPAKQQALVKASDYIDQRYSGRFYGLPMTADGLAWPRGGLVPVYANDVIPVGIQKACADLALDALAGNLSPNVAPQGALKRKKVDVLEREYFEPKSLFTIRPAIDAYMRPFVSGATLNVPVRRGTL